MTTPEVRSTADAVTFTWMSEQVGIQFEGLHERGGNLHGEISVVALIDGWEDPDHIHWARLNLASTSAREDLVKLLTKRTTREGLGSPFDWPRMIEWACTKAAQRYRAGEPFVDLSKMPRPPKLTYLLDKLLPEGQTSVIFSRGAAGKSLLSMALGVAVATGRSLPGGLTPTKPGRVLYLDYEADVVEQRLRLDWLARGLKLPAIPGILCRHQTRALADDIARLRQEVAKQQIGLVIVDSIGYALGGNPSEAELAIAAFNALRSFGGSVTRLVIAHIPSADKEAPEAKIFGSIFQENAGRSNWEARSVADSKGISMGLFQRKSNWGLKQPPIGLRFQFDNSAELVTIGYEDVRDNAELVKHGSPAFRLKALLRSGTEWTLADLSEELGEKPKTVESRLQTLRGAGEVMQVNGSRGRGNEARWILSAQKGLDDAF